MMLPGCLAIVVPVAIGCFNPAMLGGFLAGAVATGMLMAIFMSNAGGAWDNAKKYIEQGHHGGKGSEALSLIHILTGHDKRYRVSIAFGAGTDTDDAAGTAVSYTHLARQK